MGKINYPILTLLFFFISLSFIILVLFPKYQAMPKLKEVIEEWEEALQNQREYFKELSSDFEKLKNYESQFSKIDSALPKDPSLPSFFNFVSKSAEATGLNLKEVGTFAISPSTIPDVNQIETSFTVSGSYSALRNFIYVLERSARMVNIENLSFQVATEAILPGTGGSFDFNLKVKFYSY